MDNHLKFRLGEQREFLLETEKKSGLKISKLTTLVNVSSRTLRDWKKELYCITLSAAITFKDMFGVELPEKKTELIRRWKLAKKEAAKKGGKCYYLKYGSPGTYEGRKNGGKKAAQILRSKGIFPPAKEYNFQRDLNEDLAELVGILLGDGGITNSQVCITLNGEADQKYIPFVMSLAGKIVGENPKVINRKDSKAVVIYYNGINLVRHLTKIGLKPGNKVRLQVDVPRWIKKSAEYRKACLRGMMDTDGGIFLHRYRVNNKTYSYLKVSFSNRSMPLLVFVFETLSRLGFTPKIIDKIENKKVWLYNYHEVEQYLHKVGTHNPRLLRFVGG